MNIYLENEYEAPILVDYEEIIKKAVNGTIDYLECPYECEVNVTIVDNESIHQINKEHRDIDNPTDVLSFPMYQYNTPADFDSLEDEIDVFNPDTGELMLGDIVISFDKVKSQAEEYNHSQKRELAFLVTHSMLHLFGYDHIEPMQRQEMEAEQNNILNLINITRED